MTKAPGPKTGQRDSRESSVCGGDLPPRWYLEAAALVREVEHHESFAATGRAHGVSGNTLIQAWHRHGLPPRPRGVPGPAAKARESVPVDDPERVKLDGLEAELRHLRAENREYRKALASREKIVEQIVEAARVPVKVPRYTVRKRSSKLSVRTAVLPVYDCQFGQLVRPEDTPLGVGEFSVSVFDQRLERWMDAVTGSMRDYAASHAIEELTVVFGGDLVEGEDIFAGQPWQLEHDPAMQTVLFVRRWAEALRTLVAFAKTEIGVKRIMVLAIPGNHGKVGGRKKGATPSTMSWDWLASEWLRDSLRAEPVDVWGIESGGAVLFETAGHLFLAIHGDEIRGWGGLPFYGLAKYDGRAIRMSGELHDYLLMGHHHQPASIPNGSGGETIVSGDWVGANNLSRHLAAASRPQQKLLFVADGWGVTEQVPLYLAEARRERPRIYQT